MTEAPLSPTLYRIAEAIGLGLALRLADTFGGTQIYVARRPDETHPVSRCIGRDAAERLAVAFGGVNSGARIEVPKADNITRSRRDRAIIEANQGGASKQRLALKYSLTTRRVRQICNGDGEDDRQPSLFDPSAR